jgi:hypothetical protein
MKSRVNSYLATLFVTAAGALAAWVIVNVATDTVLAETIRGNETQFAALRESILQNR